MYITVSIPLPNLKRQRCPLHFLILTWYFSNLLILLSFLYPFFFSFPPLIFSFFNQILEERCAHFCLLKSQTQNRIFDNNFKIFPPTHPSKAPGRFKDFIFSSWGGVSTVFPFHHWHLQHHSIAQTEWSTLYGLFVWFEL